MADKVKIGTMWFGGCSGCHLSIADFHESLIDVMELISNFPLYSWILNMMKYQI